MFIIINAFKLEEVVFSSDIINAVKVDIQNKLKVLFPVSVNLADQHDARRPSLGGSMVVGVSDCWCHQPDHLCADIILQC